MDESARGAPFLAIPTRSPCCAFPLAAVGRVLLAAALALACGEPQGATPPGGPPPVRVQVAVAEPQTLPLTITTVGQLDSPDMTTVSSEIEGRVVALDIPEGRRVEAGHVLARLDAGEARAAVSVARARRNNARDRLERLENLRASSVSSEQAYDDAKAEFAAAYGAWDEARNRLAKTEVAAPFAGVLGLKQLNLGQVVEVGTPIVEITQVDPLDLRFNIPQRQAGEVAVGQKLTGAAGTCGPFFEGVVEVIDPRVDTATRSLKLQARVPNPDGALYPGMAVGLRLVVGEIADALLVPQEAIVRQGTKHVVYVLDEADRAEQRTVELGQFFVDGVHLRSGVEPDARVITAGQQKLRPGSPTLPEPFVPVDNPNLVLGSAGPEGGCTPSS